MMLLLLLKLKPLDFEEKRYAEEEMISFGVWSYRTLIEPGLFVGLVLSLPSRISEASFPKLIEDRRDHALHDHVDDASGDPAIPVIVGQIADA